MGELRASPVVSPSAQRTLHKTGVNWRHLDSARSFCRPGLGTTSSLQQLEPLLICRVSRAQQITNPFLFPRLRCKKRPCLSAIPVLRSRVAFPPRHPLRLARVSATRHATFWFRRRSVRWLWVGVQGSVKSITLPACPCLEVPSCILWEMEGDILARAQDGGKDTDCMAGGLVLPRLVLENGFGAPSRWCHLQLVLWQVRGEEKRFVGNCRLQL